MIKTPLWQCWIYAVCLSLCLCTPFAAHGAERSAYILAITDFHGALLPKDKNVGLVKLAGAVHAFRQAHPNTAFVAAGDLFTGSVESDVLHGDPVVQGMVGMGLQLSCVGNHEYDWGPDNLALWRQKGLPFVSANLIDTRTNRPPAGVEQYRIIDVGGVRVGFVGLMTTALPRITNPQNIQGIKVLPLAASAEKAARAARVAGAEVVILLAHLSSPATGKAWPQGISPDIAALATLPDISAIIYGHSHEEHCAVINGVPVVQPAYKGQSLAILHIYPDAAAPHGMAVQASLDQLHTRAHTIPADPAAQAVMEQTKERLGPVLDTVIGKATGTFTLDNTRPHALGELVCDALRDVTGADVALTNGGSIRASLDAGDITLRDMYSALPFENSVKMRILTGKELRRVLEYGIIAPQDKAPYDKDAPKHFVQASGIHVVYDLHRPRGQRIVSLILSDGRRVEGSTRIRVAFNSFLAKGGDGYPLKHAGSKNQSFGVREREAVMRYIQSRGVVNAAMKPWLQEK